MRISMPKGTLLSHVRHLASAEEITALTFAMAANSDFGQSTMHIGRSRLCFQGMMNMLCLLRDEGKVEITHELIHESLTLDGLIALSQKYDADDTNKKNS